MNSHDWGRPPVQILAAGIVCSRAIVPGRAAYDTASVDWWTNATVRACDTRPRGTTQYAPPSCVVRPEKSAGDHRPMRPRNGGATTSRGDLGGDGDSRDRVDFD